MHLFGTRPAFEILLGDGETGAARGINLGAGQFPGRRCLLLFGRRWSKRVACENEAENKDRHKDSMERHKKNTSQEDGQVLNAEFAEVHCRRSVETQPA